ncbi:hypothetical protein BWD12_07910 [Leptospira santarosai serovar Bananal]|uniref:Uncharacterized protein n=5 Tax=Leptospira santarosai TaxID=28183 RepID=A0AB73NAQ1_9LEPT|nr:hypothetical protein AYB33_10250 [Leptospira santarosai]OLY59042.1 hypothetical protein BV917_17730 [Leptospira santarosai serovar Guaricura]OLY62868.1 hypothetical protein BWD11_18265 [Leptospira santarosai serovar Grippotyphosa]ONF79624.1 hypothetical protein BWD12_07910 [Leptospira santarosai serovar Bananal]MBW9232803.1 hypothetical protein [Leptospira santarosai]
MNFFIDVPFKTMNRPLPGTLNTLNFQDNLSGRSKSGSKIGTRKNSESSLMRRLFLLRFWDRLFIQG